MFDFYGQVENLVKDGDVDISQKRCIVKELERLVIYESWLERQLKEVKAAYQGKDQQLKSIIDRIEDHKYIINGTQFAESTHKWHRGFLKNAMKEKADIEEGMNNLHGNFNKQEYDHLTHIIEQLKVTKKTKKYLESLAKKHETESQRIIIHVLGLKKVYIQVYFNSVINGPHCFLLF